MTSHETPRKRRPYAARMPVDQRRTELLDAALRVVARDGYDALTAQAIAHEAGVTKPVLYGAFSTLPALLEALLDREEAKALGQLMSALPFAILGDPATLAGRITRAWATAVRREPVTWQLILAGNGAMPAALADRIEAARAQLRSQLASLIGTYVPADHADPAILARALVATAEEFGRLLVSEPEQVDIDRLATTVQALVTGVAQQRRRG
ncbi:helix-turn-helix domain-containing protein [Nocardioides sp.]|uniref:TetR/AcrR family transcriptional regulator n=1 Tax=Nocardioides sp. TaxID=35761 RepID=UPI002BFF6CE9|nr:helix-turn-helix domain-containing protein [Nocardioides sp.]HSX69061.1 helix-turn-helix domain-containing protein [Nocardioides sp.]